MTYSFSRPLGWIAKSAALVAALCMLAIPLSASAQLFVGFNIGTPPPPLPYYSQPALSVPGQMWQPGYWGWGPAGYYWVPGTWVTPPSTGTYWTPGYWGYNNGGYAWNNGYWGPSVGYYGGINYGFGYPGTGYVGGMWNNGAFAYNTAVTNVNQRVVRNVYVNRTVVVRHVVNRYSYNGPGGVIARPTAAQLAYARERHIAATRLQVEHARIASEDRSLYASVNRGRPPVTAVARPIESTRSLAHYQPVTAADRAAAARLERPVHAAAHPAPAHAAHPAPAHPVPAHPAPAHPAPAHAATAHPATPHRTEPAHTGAANPAAHHATPVEHTAPVRPAPPTHTGTVNAAPHPAEHPAPAHPASAHPAPATHTAPAKQQPPASHPDDSNHKPPVRR